VASSEKSISAAEFGEGLQTNAGELKLKIEESDFLTNCEMVQE